MLLGRALGLALLLATPVVAQTRVIEGTVYDSLGHRPLAGAAVNLVNTVARDKAFSAVSDSLGRFALRDVDPGTYLAGFFHPLLDSLGIQSPVRQVTLSSSARARIDLAVPSGQSIHNAICGVTATSDSTGVFVGHVENAATRTDVRDAKVTAQWSTYSISNGRLTRSLPTLAAKTADNGWFAFCGLPIEATINLIAASGADSSGVVTVDVPARSAVHHDLYIAKAERVTRTAGDSAPVETFYRGPAHLRGIVRDATSSKPLPGVQLTVVGTGVTTTANEHGEFSLAQLPLGTQMLAARKLGYVPLQRIVDLLGDDTARVDFALPTTQSVLDTVKVFSSRIYSTDANGFARRQRSGLGHYFDANQIASIRPIFASELLERIPSVHIGSSGFERTLLMRAMTGRYCTPAIYVDGAPMVGFTVDDLDGMVHPDQIAGMEVYTSPAEVPPQFTQGFGDCGVVAVWTRPALQRAAAKAPKKP